MNARRSRSYKWVWVVIVLLLMTFWSTVTMIAHWVWTAIYLP